MKFSSGWTGWCIAATVLVGALLVSGRAAAAEGNEPATANRVQVGLGFRYGFDPLPPACEYCTWPNPFGPGIGISAGYTLPNALYLGGNFDYFFGDKSSGPSEHTIHTWQLMAEAGYDLGPAPMLVLRPNLGGGVVSITEKACDAEPMAVNGASLTNVDCFETAQHPFALAPGLTFLVLTPHLSLTLDARVAIILSERTTTAVLFGAGIGL